jgi:hypothetical protein
MAKPRGRPLIYVLLMLFLWIGARNMFRAPASVALANPAAEPASKIEPSAPKPIAEPPVMAGAVLVRSVPKRPQHPFVKQFKFRPPPALDPWQDGGRPSGFPLPALVAGGGEPLSTGRDTPPSNALAPVGKAGQLFHKRRWGREVYAYSFWRFGGGNGPSLAPGAQYGGSQSGLIATLDPFGDTDRGVAMLVRGSLTPDGSEKELALGVRWKPSADFPLSFSAERRFGIGAPDRFAAYLAGGLHWMPSDKAALSAGGAADCFTTRRRG